MSEATAHRLLPTVSSKVRYIAVMQERTGKTPCASCLMWRVALASTAIVLLVSWLAAKY